MNKRNTQSKDAITAHISETGFNPDRYGNLVNSSGTRRYKFNETSFRYEGKVSDRWFKISGGYYKDTSVGTDHIHVKG